MIEKFDESEFFRLLNGRLDERTSRLVAAAAARSSERGALGKIIHASGLAGVTIWRGYSDLCDVMPGTRADGTIRTRRIGGGRKRIGGGGVKTELKKIVEPHVRGNPVGPLTWVSKSLRKLATALTEKGFRVCHVTVGRLLEELDYGRITFQRGNWTAFCHRDRRSKSLLKLGLILVEGNAYC